MGIFLLVLFTIIFIIFLDYFHEEKENTLIVKFIKKINRVNKKTTFIPRYGDILFSMASFNGNSEHFLFFIKKHDNKFYFKKITDESEKECKIRHWKNYKIKGGVPKIKELQKQLQFHEDLYLLENLKDVHDESWQWNQEIENRVQQEYENDSYIKLYDEEMSKNFNQE